MSDSQANPRYAHALFDLVKANGESDQVEENFKHVIEILSAHKEISHIVLNSTISRLEVEDLIEKILPASFSRTLISFIKVLIRKNRFGQITAIQKIYHKLYEKDKGLEEVEVITVSPLSAAAKAKLIEVLERKLHAKIRLVEKTDPAMIGGMILRMGDREINESYRDRLFELKQILTH